MLSRFAGTAGAVAFNLLALALINVLVLGGQTNWSALLTIGAGLGAAPALLLALTPGHNHPSWAVILHCAVSMAMLFGVLLLGLAIAGVPARETGRVVVGLAALAGCGAFSGVGYVLSRGLGQTAK